MCASCHSENYLYRPVSLQACDGFVCLTDSQFREAVTSSFSCLRDAQKCPFGFSIFVLAVRDGSLVPDEYHFFCFVLFLE